jgi:chromosome partitioning protein
MAVISLANPKGGAGKSTLSLVLATTLAAQGASVIVLDCDPNRPVLHWSQGESRTPLKVRGDVTEASIIAVIDECAQSYQFVFIDLEGTASRMVSRALSRSDLVIVPMQASAVDAAQAARAINLVQEEEAVLRRPISARILFTRTSPSIKTRNEQLIVEELNRVGVPMFRRHLHQRTAYQSLFTYRLTLEELDSAKVNGLPAAIENAYALTAEMVGLVQDLQENAA